MSCNYLVDLVITQKVTSQRLKLEGNVCFKGYYNVGLSFRANTSSAMLVLQGIGRGVWRNPGILEKGGRT